ncbi:MAG: hypothetical protein JW728_05045 [Candidatus Aureabacteria bacterium]|nr:hypothetical protein [Candidatus Auribacterota bacterium]
MVRCNKCGYDNPLGKFHCMRCGERLKYDPQKEIRRNNFSVWKIIKNLLKIIIPVAAVASIVLILVEPSVTKVEESYSYKESFDNKLLQLQVAASKGRGYVIAVTGRELTSKAHYSLIDKEAEDKKNILSNMGFRIDSVYCSVESGFLYSTVVYDMKGKKIILKIKSTLGASEDGKLVFKAEEVSMGRLPISSMTVNLLLESFSKSGKYSDYFKLPYYIKDIKIVNDQILFSSAKLKDSVGGEKPSDDIAGQMDREELIIDANNCFKSGDYGKAAELYEKYLNMFPEDIVNDKVKQLLEKSRSMSEN